MIREFVTAYNQDNPAYRRGVVFGLTMAEVLLILIFCLLFPLYALVSSNDPSLEEDETPLSEIPEIFQNYDNWSNLEKLHAIAENCDLKEEIESEEFLTLLSNCFAPQDSGENNRLAELEKVEGLVVTLAKRSGMESKEFLQLLSNEDFKVILANLIDCFQQRITKEGKSEIIELLSDISDCLQPEVIPVDPPPIKEPETTPVDTVSAEESDLKDALQKFGEEISENNDLNYIELTELVRNEDFNEIVLRLIDCFQTNIERNGKGEFLELISNISDCIRPIPEPKTPEPPTKESGHDWPPIIEISEAAGYSFKSGKSELSPNFKELLETTVLEKIIDQLIEYEANVVEVIGHTDEQPVSSSSRTDLDKSLFDFLTDKDDDVKLNHADNAGLGISRAASVARVLIEQLKNRDEVQDIVVLPYSGAQVINTDDTLSLGKDIDVEGQNSEQSIDAKRRRIEIRVRGSKKYENPITSDN